MIPTVEIVKRLAPILYPFTSPSRSTDFNVASNVNVNGDNGNLTAGLGNSPLVMVQQMIVRSEDDIRKVSQELYNLMQAGSRAQGRFNPAT